MFKINFRSSVLQNINSFHLKKLIIIFKFISQEPPKQLINEAPLVENMNRLEPDTIEASGIDEAIQALR